MTDLDLEKKIEFALNDLVNRKHSFSLGEVNNYLGPENKMDFKQIFEIAHPMLEKMSVSFHGVGYPSSIIVTVKEPFLSNVHVVQRFFPDFMQEHEWVGIIASFKEKGDTKWVKILGGLLVEYVRRNPELKEVDFIVPVPCEKETAEKLGYDPNMLLANEIVKETSIPVIKVFSKTRQTNLCETKSLSEKEELIKSAFTLDNEMIMEKHVLLLDDTMNSGTTIKELSRMLEGAGAKKASALVLTQTRQSV